MHFFSINKQISTGLLLLLSLAFSSCGGETDPFPRQYGHPRIDMPKELKYSKFESASCPFTFEYPAIAEISRNQPDSCWIDVSFPQYNCKWHLSSRGVGDKGKDRNFRYEEARKLVFKHIKKTDGNIPEIPIQTKAGYGVKWELYGQVGTPMEFFFGDENTTIMGSFYFQTALKNDSLQPVIQFMKKEMDRMITTIEWK
ncbi:MAG: hypothetical protein ACKVTZ_01845 [Bacteroidia bacterium]